MPRPRLVEQLLDSPSARLVLLTAPAGYSKTTCLAEWAAADRRPFAWIAASSRHDDAAVLIASVVEALDEIEPVDPDVVAALASPRPSISSFVLPRMGRSLGDRSAPFVLVIDDAHALTSGTALEVLEVVIGSLPPGSQLALGSRTEPPLPLARLRANRQLVELGEEELAMTKAESGALLHGINRQLSPSQLDLIFERTEGWPAALYLAGLSLAGQPDTGAAIASFAGDDRIVSDYVRDELLASLTPARLAFMTRTAILDELHGPGCDAVLERSGSARVLRELARSNALVVPLDSRDERYRYHHLLAEYLMSELRRREPETEAELHARASRWYEAEADSDRAIEHAIAAGEVDRAGELIWLAFPELSGRGRIATLERWLQQVEDRGTSYPVVALASAYRHVALGHGEDAAHWARVAEASVQRIEEEPESIRGHTHLLKAALAADGVLQMDRDAACASELLAPDSPWQSPCFFYRGVATHLTGHRESAIEPLREAARRGAVVSPLMQGLALAQLTMVAVDEGDWREASRLIAQARGQVSRCGLTEYPVMAMVFAVSAVVRSHDGEIDDALSDVEQARHLVAELSGYLPWYEAQARLAIVRACARLDDAAGARALLDEASGFLSQTRDATVLRRWLIESSAALESVAGAAQRGEFSLTAAELRTLQYLPSHLSFPEIARRIHVSPNTVKTQAQAVYRKLDATSRAEAVERARHAGLLDKEPPLSSRLEQSPDPGDVAPATPS